MSNQFSLLVEKLLDRLINSPGALPSRVRQAVLKRAAASGGATLEGGEVPTVLQAYVDKVSKHAYKVTDEDVAELRAAGFSEDQLFELTLSAATGAAWARLDRGLAALKGGR